MFYQRKFTLGGLWTVHDVAEIHSTPQMTAQNIMSQCADSKYHVKKQRRYKIEIFRTKINMEIKITASPISKKTAKISITAERFSARTHINI